MEVLQTQQLKRAYKIAKRILSQKKSLELKLNEEPQQDI